MQKSLSELKTARRPLIIAHRGYRAKYPENTMAAFEAAIDVGVDMIELDVLRTKDRDMVVIHDESLDRTTNGHGMVSDYTLSELRALDAGVGLIPALKGNDCPPFKRFWIW
jgi:glycerophosphoryl diester phosphodiesterase